MKNHYKGSKFKFSKSFWKRYNIFEAIMIAFLSGLFFLIVMMIVIQVVR